jgi:glycosyltransferase involved in cell wall biosynthesis
MKESTISPSGITTLVVNYKTADLTQRCVESFLQWYPDARLVLIDNGSRDGSTGYIAQVASRFENGTCILNQENRYHGPAMDQGIRSATTRYVLTLDSDCQVYRGGFLEEMHGLFQDPKLYATGRKVYMNQFGFETKADGKRDLIPYIQPYAMLLDGEKYLHLSRFVHHGSPCLANMKDSQRKGYELRSFPIEAFISHQWRGTCSRYGYGLGPRTLIESLLSRLGILCAL